MKVSKAIKLCKRAQIEKDRATLKDRCSYKHYVSTQEYKHLQDSYQNAEDEFILNMVRERANPYSEVPVITVNKNTKLNLHAYYERLNNLYEEPNNVRYEGLKPLNI